ncbi:Mlo-related protein [Corchorus olitorius]|uniref:Mlo-related protein n=1 Tax=Corchorus olitorius TaxID=93759 RepID=A0A1R3KSC3_9ROSI|nr:Mlo-related protein [Corchorus olitorius]
MKQYEYGLRSCFNQGTEDFAIRIVMGVVVQLLCGYQTLPLYALVTQMGSGMNSAVFTERVARGLKNWHHKAKVSVSRGESTSPKDLSNSILLHDNINASVKDEVAISHCCNEIREDDVEPAMPITSSPSAPENEIFKEKAKRAKSYDGEISFGSSWRKSEDDGNSNGIGEIIPVIEEDTSNFTANKP